MGRTDWDSLTILTPADGEAEKIFFLKLWFEKPSEMNADWNVDQTVLNTAYRNLQAANLVEWQAGKSFWVSTLTLCGPRSSVGIATELRAGRSGI